MAKKKAAAPTPISGFRIRPRYRDVECDWFELEEGEEPFRATIRRNLTFEQIHAIPDGDEATFDEIWKEIAPYVTGWNLLAEDDKGEVVPVPPPAEAGPDVSRMLDAQMSLWLILQVRQAHLGGAERKNTSAPSGDTPGPGGASK